MSFELSDSAASSTKTLMPHAEHLARVSERKRLLRKQLESIVADRDSLVLEIGCGHGHWLTDYAASHEGQFCLGIDIIGNRIDRANRKANRAQLSNVQFMRAEAREVLELLPETVSIQSVFILFPDPWPKKRHWKNRIMNPAFLESLASRCREAARLHFRTDHTEYFEWTERIIDGLEGWGRLKEADWPFERETVFQSKADDYQSLILEKKQ